MGLTRGALSKLADRLSAKGLIARTADARDKRAHTLALPPRGASRPPLERLLKDYVARLGAVAVPLD